MRSICLSLLIACEALEATERKRRDEFLQARAISFCWFL